MNSHLKAALAILLIGSLGIGAARFILPQFQDRLSRSTSDAAEVKASLRIGSDSWIGYYPLCSAEMARRMRAQGYALICEDDQADYASRFRRLQAGELQFAVASIDAYLLNGAASGYPGAIIAVLDESQGGDAIVARRDAIASLADLRPQPGLSIAYTPNSPSAQLLKSISEHFDLGLFTGDKRWQVPSQGSGDALQRLLKGQVAAAVLWEPDVSRALAEPGLTKLIGTEDTDKLVVDVLLVERRFSSEQPELVQLLLRTYFEQLQQTLQQPDQLAADVARQARVDPTQAEAMLQGVAWAGLIDNGLSWFGLLPEVQVEEGLISAINSTLSILRAQGDFSRNPLPDGDPYRLTNRQFIAQLFDKNSAALAQVPSGDPLARPFAPLDEAGWRQLREIGALKIEPVSFRRSAAMLDLTGKQVLDRMAEKLRHYPNFRILVKGHTGLQGDPEANLALSAERAEAVARYLMVTYNLDANRIRALGLGGSAPLPRQPGESDRAYGYRLPRVEISLAREAR
jgi:outer membrane protein OmpA-like peptidoglycan-associated protein/ABC-type nitrate/sulfonate/bicarbonate transport system substrate-binding protein